MPYKRQYARSGYKPGKFSSSSMLANLRNPITRSNIRLSKGTTKYPYQQKSVPRALSDVVRSVVSQLSETKESTITWTNLPVFNVQEYQSAAVMYANYNLLNLNPGSTSGSIINITQGTGQANRIGNKIRPKKVTLDIMFNPKPYNETTNIDPIPCEIIIWIIKPRVNAGGNVAIGDIYTACTTGGLFQLGNSDYPMEGELIDCMMKVQKEKFILLEKRRIKVGNQFYDTSVPNGYSNNDFKYNQRVTIDVTPYMDKTIHFDDTTANCYNTPIYFLMEKVRADNLAVGSVTNQADCIAHSGVYTFEYLDY